jgi:hypothetical protein
LIPSLLPVKPAIKIACFQQAHLVSAYLESIFSDLLEKGLELVTLTVYFMIASLPYPLDQHELR